MNEDLFSGLSDIREGWLNPQKSDLTFVDLFAGCGGLSLGLTMAGLKGVAAVENKESASITYAHNFSHPVITGDITLDSTKQLLYDTVHGNVDVVVGGPPCQGFSMAGKRLIDDPRNVLYKQFVEIVEHLRPSYIVMENVPGILSMKDGAVIQQIIQDFNRAGYDVSVRVLNAADYLTPQIRKRTIIIGNNVGKRNLHPAPLVTSQHYVTVKDAIFDLTDAPEDYSFSQIYTQHNASKVERISHLLPGECYSESYHGTLRRLSWDKPSFTVTYSHGNPDIHPERNMVLTIRELARLQSFPDEFLFFGNKDQQGLMVGNAVPPFLGKAIGLSICNMNRS